MLAWVLIIVLSANSMTVIPVDSQERCVAVGQHISRQLIERGIGAIMTCDRVRND